MTEHQTPSSNHWNPDRADTLIGRVTDGEAAASDWDELERLAGADPDIWRQLACAQRAQARLTAQMDDQLAVAELVDLPDPEPIPLPWVGAMRRWSGWGLAAALGLAWVLTQVLPVAPPAPGPFNTAGFGGGMMQPVFVSNTTPDDAWMNYIETARLADSFVAELPLVLVESQMLPSGAHQVFYIRRSLERATLTDMTEMRVSEDEQGRTVLISVPTAPESESDSQPI